MSTLPGLDADALAAYLRASRVAEADTIEVVLLAGGRSNLTYGVDVDGQRWVLRRPPRGVALDTAHDMSREYTVMSALAPSSVPVPRMITICEDAAVLGAPFYLMERVDGPVLRTFDDVLALPSGTRRSLGLRLIDTLADLHMIDPASVGLADFGRPVGFMERQVRRWTRQLKATQESPLAGIADLASALAGCVPDSNVAAIVHGDYRLDNCVAGDGDIAAVLDWEMSTLGHPLADLATFVVYHDGLADLPNPVVDAPGRLPDVPRIEELLTRYQSRTGLQLDQLDWYVAFAWFKLAVILDGVRHRTARGHGEGNDVSGLIEPAVARGRLALERT